MRWTGTRCAPRLCRLLCAGCRHSLTLQHRRTAHRKHPCTRWQRQLTQNVLHSHQLPLSSTADNTDTSVAVPHGSANPPGLCGWPCAPSTAPLSCTSAAKVTARATWWSCCPTPNPAAAAAGALRQLAMPRGWPAADSTDTAARAVLGWPPRPPGLALRPMLAAGVVAACCAMALASSVMVSVTGPAAFRSKVPLCSSPCSCCNRLHRAAGRCGDTAGC